MKYKEFNWPEILGDQAWTAKEIAEKLGIKLPTLRRYLRIGEYSGDLEVRKKGKVKFYRARQRKQ